MRPARPLTAGASAGSATGTTSSRTLDVEAQLGERGVEHVGVGGKAVEEVDGRVGGLDAGRLRAGHAAAVVGADGLEHARLEERLAGEDLAGVGVVDAEALALELGARGADGVLAGDGVELLLAEGQGHDELAEVVQQAAEVGGLDVGAGALGQGAGDGGHLAGVHVQQPARRAAGAGRELEEAADGGLEGETPDADAADEGDGLAHGLRADGARARGGVGEAQDVGGEPGVGLDARRRARWCRTRGRRRARGRAAGRDRAPAAGRCARWRPAAGRRPMGSVGAKGASSCTDRRQQRSGVERWAPWRTVSRAVRAGASGAQRWGGWADAGVPAPGGLVGRAALRLVDLGRDHRVVLTNTTVGRMFHRDHHPGVWSGG